MSETGKNRKQTLTNQDSRPKEPAELRQKAEAIARERDARTPEDSAALSPGELLKTQHELQVHRIELEMQNEELRTASEHIKNGRDRYYDLYNLAPVGYCTLSEKGVILEANLKAAFLLGTTRGALVKQPIFRFIHNNDQDLYSLHRKKLFKTGEPRKCELRLVKPDGEFIWAHVTETAAQAEDGTPVCRVVLTDISDRKQAEMATRENEARQSFILSVNPTIIYTLRPDDFAAAWVSSNVTALMGYTEEEALEPGWWAEHVHPEDLEQAIANGSRVLETSYIEHEYRFFKKDGAECWLCDRIKLHGTPGDPEEIIGAWNDITERKQAENELRRLSTAIEQSPDTVIITDTAGTIQYVNPAFETATGYTREEVLGQNPRILNSGQQDAGFYKVMWDTLQDGRVWEGRMVNKRKDGTLYTEDGSIAPVKDNKGTIANYVAVKRDITGDLAREDMLNQAQKMESVGRLAGGVAHDFNNLLMGIMGYAELCRDNLPADHPVREWVGEILREAERSANLTRQLLAFARKQTVAPQVLDLNDAVGNMLRMLRRLIGEDIDLVWQPGAELWSVMIDPGQVDQILANLCVNARDAIGGVGRVGIETENVSIDSDYSAEHVEAAAGSYVMLAVSDDGCGMDRETLRNVFEPFFTTKAIGEGTGLGLATVYGIVKQNNGFVNVYSEPGKGTTFRMYLPRDTSVNNDAEEPAAKTESLGGTETILLVEDETAIRTIMCLVLEKLGYTPTTCSHPVLRLSAGGSVDGRLNSTRDA